MCACALKAQNVKGTVVWMASRFKVCGCVCVCVCVKGGPLRKDVFIPLIIVLTIQYHINYSARAQLFSQGSTILPGLLHTSLLSLLHVLLYDPSFILMALRPNNYALMHADIKAYTKGSSKFYCIHPQLMFQI